MRETNREASEPTTPSWVWSVAEPSQSWPGAAAALQVQGTSAANTDGSYLSTHSMHLFWGVEAQCGTASIWFQGSLSLPSPALDLKTRQAWKRLLTARCGLTGNSTRPSFDAENTGPCC